MVSGDYLLHEVYNGIMDKPDADLAIQMPVGRVKLLDLCQIDIPNQPPLYFSDKEVESQRLRFMGGLRLHL
ncbi:hypothetical protein BIW11_03210 [Tropilaelaps mercedesae]|uniref:Uncharacterized protein n=1 Tax=Tropilaelaps mercedesae TaxID=418985 RepID=A0A1V9XQB9_9ACAR|nr:hypothetical protein BIW11_03210 [Tropilaelaps mercedesae]